MLQALDRAGAKYVALDAKPARLLIAGTGPFGPGEVHAELAGKPNPFGGHLAEALRRMDGVPSLSNRRLRAGDDHGAVQWGVYGESLFPEAVSGLYIEADVHPTITDRFRRRLDAWAVEHAWLRCPLLVNGNAPFGLRNARPLGKSQSGWAIRTASASGFLEPLIRGPGVQLLVHGVWVATAPLHEVHATGLTGRLRCELNVADGNVVRDDRYDALVHALRAAIEPS